MGLARATVLRYVSALVEVQDRLAHQAAASPQPARCRNRRLGDHHLDTPEPAAPASAAISAQPPGAHRPPLQPRPPRRPRPASHSEIEDDGFFEVKLDHSHFVNTLRARSRSLSVARFARPRNGKPAACAKRSLMPKQSKIVTKDFSFGD